VGADTKTVKSYFEILSDTLLGFFLDSHHASIRKQQRQSPKFYFFDMGVTRALSRRLTARLVPNTYGFGKTFEHFIITEIYKLNSYLRKDYTFSYLQTKDGAEIDLIINQPSGKILLIEIKSTDKIDERAIRTLRHFQKDFPQSEALVISRDRKEKRLEGILALPWDIACQKIFDL
jgi:predicted AAA+ superfamily ATPase